MALFSFSGKNKNTPDQAQAEAKAPVAPPKLQPPPTPGLSVATPPLPSTPPLPTPTTASQSPGAPPLPRPGTPAAQPGTPAVGRAVSASTRGVTQPIVMPKRGPGAAPVRSTQRIVVPGAAQAPEAPQFHTSTIQLPVAMILRALPMQALNGSLADLERSPSAAQKIAVPLSMILPQLPSGKIEIALQELANLLPPELLVSKDRLAPFMSNMVHFPLMEVVMLIPPDMLALRPDQKQVDAAVSNMADPFTEESIRKAAEETRQQKQAAEAGITGTGVEGGDKSNPLAASMTSTAPMPRSSRPAATPPPTPQAAQAPAAMRPPTPPPAAPPTPVAAQAPQAMPPVTRLPTPATMSRPGTISLPMVTKPNTAAMPNPHAATTPTAPPPNPAMTAAQPVPTPAIPSLGHATQRMSPPPTPVTQPPMRPLAAVAQTPPPPEPEPVVEEDYAEEQVTEEAVERSTPTPEEQEAPPTPMPSEAPKPARPAGPLNLNTCAPEDLALIPGISAEVAASIVTYRDKIGAFRKLQDLLDVPLMTRGIYALLTGEDAQPNSINDLLGFPLEHVVSLKDITERISCWPDVTGCVLGQSNGLVIVGHLSPKVKLDKGAIVAFAPRMFETLNKSFAEISGIQTDELIIPTQDTSFHILRKANLYLIILARTPQMPSRHLQVARLVLASLNFK